MAHTIRHSSGDTVEKMTVPLEMATAPPEGTDSANLNSDGDLWKMTVLLSTTTESAEQVTAPIGTVMPALRMVDRQIRTQQQYQQIPLKKRPDPLRLKVAYGHVLVSSQ